MEPEPTVLDAGAPPPSMSISQDRGLNNKGAQGLTVQGLLGSRWGHPVRIPLSPETSWQSIPRAGPFPGPHPSAARKAAPGAPSGGSQALRLGSGLSWRLWRAVRGPREDGVASETR